MFGVWDECDKAGEHLVFTTLKVIQRVVVGIRETVGEYEV